MEIVKFLEWILIPSLVVVIGYFTSKITSHREIRYLISFLILLLAFITDLQSFSFSSYYGDLIFSIIVSSVFSDIVWRFYKRKNKILKVGALTVGVILFASEYHDWILSGPINIDKITKDNILSYSKKGDKIYCTKMHCSRYTKISKRCDIKLIRCFPLKIFEKEIESYKVPKGYENADFTFRWDTTGRDIAAYVIGNKDTLWTLGKRFAYEYEQDKINIKKKN
ncbi:MAG: hypothetical protein N2053_07320 [Chitinispirillaceae bacterium]|nr:hypothetical protein [Chitinispirillaceae bacterium]